MLIILLKSSVGGLCKLPDMRLNAWPCSVPLCGRKNNLMPWGGGVSVFQFFVCGKVEQSTIIFLEWQFQCVF